MGDLGKLIVDKGFKIFPKVPQIIQSGHTGCNLIPINVNVIIALGHLKLCDKGQDTFRTNSLNRQRHLTQLLFHRPNRRLFSISYLEH